jgi:3-oxoacyl-[acyl-carrier-protein] synthase II
MDHSRSTRIAITGMGMTNSLGSGVETVWRRLLAGDSGVTKISLFDASQYRCRVAAEVSTFHGAGLCDPDGFVRPEPPEIRRGTAIFLDCAREAFEASGLLESGFDAGGVGVAAGVSAAFLDMPLTLEYWRHRRADQTDVDTAAFPVAEKQPAHNFTRRLADAAAVLTARRFGLRGPTLTIDTACAASGHSIGEAVRLIRSGRAKAMLAGGSCAVVSPIGILYFAVLGALSRNEDPATASRPFHRDRDGFVMGDGGGVVVLEDWDYARARGARILAELAGYGANTCAINLTDPSADGVLEAQAMRRALDSGGVPLEEVGYIAAHGTSTLKNDRTEAKAIAHLYGGCSARARRVPVSSNKGQIGHTISGAAVTNLICSVLAMRDGIVPPTVNLTMQDPAIDLDCVPNQARRAPVEAAIINSFAFGGHNAVLAVRRASS